MPEARKSSLLESTGWNLSKYSPWPIFWVRIPDARLVGPNLAILGEAKMVAAESVWNDHCYKDDASFNCLILPPVRRLEGPWTSVVGRFCCGYFHWFMDALPRLACVDQFPPDARILVPSELQAYQRESLALLNLSDRVRPVSDKHLIVEEYYFSSPTAMTGVGNPYAINFLRKRFVRSTSGGKDQQRLFIVRRSKTRGMNNESEVAEFLRGRGWHVVDLEELTLAQQIDLFQNAAAVCALHGAGLTNLLWCRPGTRVLEVCSSNFLNSCYESIAVILDLDHRFAIFRGDSRFRITLPLSFLKENIGWLEETR